MTRYVYPSLSPILHHLVMRAPSGIGAQRIASMMGWKYATMMSELSGQPGHKCGVERLLPIMDVTDSDEPLHFLAHERGGVFVKLPTYSEDESPIQQQCLVAVKEFGELIATCAEALADMKLEKDERDRITREGHEAVTAIMGLLKLVEDV
ncbi:phage regulatory CII family protein [Desulfovibrio inopinatus]|uniref:phage regulatory CII family protein n=1 Tax=Desulfovibrio inopinatus TaxID=102109 RepID=UPI00041BBED3|nr:phage regulatory CII family protein [Desulfovibrio inopinatus]